MEEYGVIVKEDEHTSWASSMLVIDKRKVKDKKRAHYPMVTVEEVAKRRSGAKSFTSLHACSGYWQLPVDHESSKLLTFNKPRGRYRLTRLPFGISPAPEMYQREMDRLFEGVPVEIILDDFLIHGKD